MKDILINNDTQSESFMDIILAPDEDFAENIHQKQIVLNEIMEQFDMVVGDDIDFPMLHSEQMAHTQSDDPAAPLARIADAERMLREHPLIDNNTIQVNVNDQDQIVVDFDLVPSASIEKFLMK
jgi:hypothetical protein